MPARRAPDVPWFPGTDLFERLTFGELPGVAIAARDQRADLLRAYTVVYLEEELRREREDDKGRDKSALDHRGHPVAGQMSMIVRLSRAVLRARTPALNSARCCWRRVFSRTFSGISR